MYFSKLFRKKMDSCPICKSKDVMRLKNHEDFPLSTIFWCPNCEYGFCNPMPDTTKLKQYYQSSYRNNDSFSEAVAISRLTRAHAQLQFIEETLGQQTKDTVFLDIGCGIGAVIHLLEKKGYYAFGVDEDPLAIDWGKKKFTTNIGHEVPPDFRNPDILLFSHVIEHFPDITAALKKWKRTRYLFIEVPHANKDVALSKPPVSHVHFFTPQSLCYVLEAAGLHIRAMNTYGIPMTDYLANTLSKQKHEYFGDIRPAGDGTVIRLIAEWK